MKTETQEKLLHLLSAVLPENMKHLVGEVMDGKISLQQFRENCHLATLSPEEQDNYRHIKKLDERFAGMNIYDYNKIIEFYASRYPQGMDFKVDGLGMKQIEKFIHEGHLFKTQDVVVKVGDLSDSTDGMQCTFHLPVSEYRLLWVSDRSHRDDDLAEWLDSKGYNADYMTASTVAMNQHPDGQDVSMYFSEDELYKFLKIEGQPLWRAVAIKLQFPDLDQDTLVRYLRNPHEVEDLMQQYEMAAQDEAKFYATDTVDMDQLHMIKGGFEIFLFEDYKLGYAAVDIYRNVKTYGEPLTEPSRKRLEELVERQHYIHAAEGKLKDFFIKEPKTEDRPCTIMHRETAQCMDAHELINHDGTRFYQQSKYNDIQNHNDYEDITGRMTDVHLITQGSLRIRCKIDGQQCSARFLEYPERLRYSCGFNSPQEEKQFLFETAVKLFHNELLPLEQQQAQSFKR